MSTESHDAVENEIYRAIRKVKPSLAQTPLTPETRLESLGLASLERTIITFELEDVYDLSIVEANLDTYRTVAEARDTILELMERKAQRPMQAAEGAA